MTSLIESQLKIALDALQQIEEDTHDNNSKNLAQHAQIKIHRLRQEAMKNEVPLAQE